MLGAKYRGRNSWISVIQESKQVFFQKISDSQEQVCQPSGIESHCRPVR